MPGASSRVETRFAKVLTYTAVLFRELAHESKRGAVDVRDLLQRRALEAANEADGQAAKYVRAQCRNGTSRSGADRCTRGREPTPPRIWSVSQSGPTWKRKL
jgi:hypothetical protein